MTTGRELEANISTLLGLNNRRPDFRLRTKDGVFVRAASNVDISDAGTAKRRPGATLAAPGADSHSLWADEDVGMLYYVAANTLYRAEAARVLAPQALGSAVRGRALSYAKVGDEVICSDGTQNRAIAASGIVRPLGATPPSTVPEVAAATGGALREGAYQVSTAFQNDGLEISPATPAAQVAVPDRGQLLVSRLPAVWPADAARMFIYISEANGTELYLAQVLDAPTPNVTIPTAPTGGMRISTYLLSTMPPGRIVRWHMGRLYVVAGATLWYSEIYSPGLCSPTKNFVSFPAPITVLEPCDDGMFLVADATYWIAGDISTGEAKKVSPARGVLGTGGQDRTQARCFWMSEQGLVLGSPGGEVQLPQAENVAVGRAESGASAYRESDGQRHIVSTVFKAPGAATAAHSYMDAEVIRKGTST